MYKLIIDTNKDKYYPQFNLSQTLNIEFNIDKYDHAYVYVDNINLFRRNYKQYNMSKTTFLYDKNIVFDMGDINIKIISCEANITEDFKKKIIKHPFIYNFLFKGKKNEQQ